MAKRSIQDNEIALIKAMLARGMKNKDIQFYFNRPNRPVNSGRITGIRKGIYGLSGKIGAASDAELEKFIAENSPTSRDPLSDNELWKLFKKNADGTWLTAGGESERLEFKSNFGARYSHAWLRAAAALANNAGGYILFGISDAPSGSDGAHAVIGLPNDEFRKIDPAEISKKLKAIFDPTPQVRRKFISLDKTQVGVFYVEKHQSRPVIATKTEGDKINEGDIFFRYSGQSTRIKYSDLRSLLDSRDIESRSKIIPMIEKLITIGPKRALIADLEGAVIGDGKTVLHIDKDLAEKLQFIKEGDFKEVKGAPALRLVGDVKATTSSQITKVERELLTRTDVFNAFLDQARPDQPERYIRFPLEVGQGEWFPIHYFARLSGLSTLQLAQFIKSTKGSLSRKNSYLKRIQPNAAYKKATGKPEGILKSLIAGHIPKVSNSSEASHVGQAIQGLPNGSSVTKETLLKLLRTCMDHADQQTSSFVRRAISRVDELFFAEK